MTDGERLALALKELAECRKRLAEMHDELSAMRAHIVRVRNAVAMLDFICEGALRQP